MDLAKYITDIPDYPKPGILFRDITTLWKDPKAFAGSIDLLYERFKNDGITKVVSAEARGFIVGAPLAYKLGAGFVPVRKKGKLPRQAVSETYDLEYGQDTVQIHSDAIQPGDKVLIADDLIATGGTLNAMISLVKKLGGTVVHTAFLVELTFLKPQEKVNAPIFSLIKY